MADKEIELTLLEFTKEELRATRVAIEDRMIAIGRQGASQDYDSKYAALPFDRHQELQGEYKLLSVLRERLV